MKKKSITENEVKLALNQLVEEGLLKIIIVDGVIYYVNPDYPLNKEIQQESR